MEQRRWPRWLNPVVGAYVVVTAAMAVVATPLKPKFEEVYSQWLLDYREGIIKRGFTGEIIQNLVFRSGPISAHQMFVLSSALSLVTLVLLGTFCFRVWRQRYGSTDARPPASWHDPEVLSFHVATILLVFAPIGAMYYVSNSSYLELVNVFILAVFANIALFRPRGIVLLAVLVVASFVSTAVHESALLSTVPLMGLMCLVAQSGTTALKRTLAVLAVLYLACWGLVMIEGANSSQVAHQIVQRTELRYPTSPKDQRENTAVLTRTLRDNIAFTFDKYKSVTGGGSRVLLSLLVCLPALVFLATWLARMVKPGFRILVVGATLAPFGLVFLGDDVYRWYTLAVIGLCVLTLFATSRPVEESGLLVQADADGETSSSDVALGLPPLIAVGIVALVVAIGFPYPYFLSANGNPMGQTFAKLLSAVKHLVP